MDTSDFRKLIKENLKPVLADMGFKGSDHHFIKKSNDHYIYTLVIQSNRYGGSCIMEMGVHIDFIEMRGTSNNLTVYDCEFRKRIKQEITLWDRITGKTTEKWHEYGKDESQALRTIKKMSEHIQKQGTDYFNQFDKFPNPIIDISLKELITGSKRIYNLGSPPKTKLALILSTIHKYLGNRNEQIEFAEWGLNNIGNAIALKDEFIKLCQEE